MKYWNRFNFSSRKFIFGLSKISLNFKMFSFIDSNLAISISYTSAYHLISIWGTGTDRVPLNS